MAKKSSLKPVAAALGTTFAVTLAASPLANAAENPFSITTLESGYMVAGDHEGKCGEGKCGGDKEAERKQKPPIRAEKCDEAVHESGLLCLTRLRRRAVSVTLKE